MNERSSLSVSVGDVFIKAGEYNHYPLWVITQLSGKHDPNTVIAYALDYFNQSEEKLVPPGGTVAHRDIYSIKDRLPQQRLLRAAVLGMQALKDDYFDQSDVTSFLVPLLQAISDQYQLSAKILTPNNT